MRRPRAATIAIWIESVVAAVLIGTAVYAFLEAVHARNARVEDQFEDALITAGVMGAIGVPVLIASWGLWKSKAWGWWLGVVFDLLGLIVFLWDPIERRVWPDIQELFFTVFFSITLVLLFVPAVRRFFFRRNVIKNAEAGALQA
jgi:uncharacterized membrane protein (DUF2068 family)